MGIIKDTPFTFNELMVAIQAPFIDKLYPENKQIDEKRAQMLREHL